MLLGGASAAALLSVSSALAQTPAPAGAPGDETLEEVVVTGSRLQATGFSAPTPVSVVSAALIEERAKPTIGETLFELPAFRATTGPGQNARGTLNAGQAVLELRGLGPSRTLVLVDGVRPVPTVGIGSFDTNMLPSLMVDRVDVVTGGASAAYGTDAVAGVVNFVLKRNLEGWRADVRYGISQEGDAEEYGVGAAFGHTAAGGRLHLVVGGDLSKSEGAGTAYSRDWGRQDSDIIALTATRPAGIPAFFATDDVQNTTPTGSLITSCVRGSTVLTGAACPLNGLTFTDAGQPTPFVFGSLVGNATMAGGGNPGKNARRFQLLKQGYERAAVLGTVTYDLADDLKISADIGAGRFKVHSVSSDYLAPANFIRVQRSNPFLPAALAAQMDAAGITEVRMNRENSDIGGVVPSNKSSYLQAQIKLEGKVFDEWKWDVSVGRGSNEFVYKTEGFVILPNYYAALYAVRAPDGSIVCGPSATNPMLANLTPAQRTVIQPGCVPFNPFGSNPNSQAAIDYVSGIPASKTDDIDRTTAAANLSGDLFQLPAGPVSLAVGYEFHKDKLKSTVPAESAAIAAASGFLATNFLPGGGDISVHEGFAEVGVPVLKDVPFAHALDLNGAVRIADYSSTGSVTTWKVGGTWEPVEWLRLRATRSRDIRAPNIPELFIRGTENFGTLVNPRTSVAAGVRNQAINNPNLDPEKADTTTAGIVFQPREGLLANLRVSVDYFDIKLNDVIASLTPTEVLRRYYVENDQAYAQFIEFDASPIGFTKVSSPILNLNRQETDGFDIEVSYRSDLNFVRLPGTVAISAFGTNTRSLQSFDQLGRPLGQLAGEITGVPKWRWTGNFTYQLERLTTTLSVRYNSELKYRFDLLDPTDAGYDPKSSLSINDNRFPDAAYYSLSARYRLRDEITIYGVIDNLFDTDPPRGSFYTINGANPYDVVGRYFRVGVNLRY